MRQAIMLLTAAATVVLAGCDVDIFMIEMTPRQERIERTFGAWRGSASGMHLIVEAPGEKQPESPQESKKNSPPTSLTPERLAALEKIYGKPFEPDKKMTATFGDTLPDDVGGGSGTYLHWPTTMGSASVYAEHFRGAADPAAALQGELAKADKLVDHVIGWLTAELGKEPGFDGLKTFLETDFRQDVRNITFMAWTAQSLAVLAPQGESGDLPPLVKTEQGTMLARGLQFLVDRGYFARNDTPVAARAVEGFFGRSPKPFLAMIQRLAATKMGVAADKPVPVALELLGDPEKASASLTRYLESTPEYKELVRQWQEKRKAESADKPADGAEGVADAEEGRPKAEDVLAVPANLLPLAGDEDGVLGVRLATGVEPWFTNGVWLAEEGRVAWATSLPKETMWPKMLTALWSQPDEAFQKERFGRVVLSGENLHSYCLWRRGLTEAEGKQWDGFVAALKPGPKLKDELRAFRFAGEPTEPEPGKEQPPESYAAEAVRLILDGFPPEEESKADADGATGGGEKAGGTDK